MSQSKMLAWKSQGMLPVLCMQSCTELYYYMVVQTAAGAIAEWLVHKDMIEIYDLHSRIRNSSMQTPHSEQIVMLLISSLW